MLNDFSAAADYYDRIFAARNKDYAKESAEIARLIRERSPGAKTLLDVACGTGKHLTHLSQAFTCKGVDRDDRMLEIARKRLPALSFAQGDMRDFALHQRFDAITCMFGSITYVGTKDALDRAVATMRDHLTPGGVIVIEPFVGPSAYKTGHAAMVTIDEPDLKLARMHVSARRGDVAILNHHIMVAKEHDVEYFVERHELALFDESDYAAAFERAGLRSHYVKPASIPAGLHVAWNAPA